MVAAFIILDPPKSITIVFKGEITSWLKLIAEVFLQLIFKSICRHPLNCILKSRLPTVSTITKVTLHKHHLFGDINSLVWRHKANQVGCSWKRVFFAMSHAHTTTYGDIIANHFFIFDNCNERQALCVYVSIVARRHCYIDFKLPR